MMPAWEHGWISLAVAALALWRASAWLWREDGATRTRAWLCRWTFWAGKVSCFWCVTLWLSLPVALVWWLWWPLLLPLALSGAAILLSGGGRIIWTEMRDEA
jgi:hypothetical protein